MTYDPRLITDMGLHAGGKAMEAMITVLETLPHDGYKTAASAVAAGFLQYKLDELKEIMPPDFVKAVDEVAALLKTGGTLDAIKRQIQEGKL